MNSLSLRPAALRLAYFGVSVALSAGMGLAGESPRPWKGDVWRAHHRVIDLHQHIEGLEERFQRALRINDRVGVGVAVNLSGGTVTHKPGEISEFQRVSELAQKVAPDRFLSYFNLDYTGLDDPDFSARAVKQVEEAHRLGAAGLKEYKRLGLTIRNKAGEILPIDDPRLDPVWKRCGELKLPVSIHVADPKAFWLPYNQQNERWKELKDHPKWWFGDPKQFPSREQLLAALDRVIVRHTNTTFVCVHFANNSEDLDWVERMLDTRPNMNADLAARIPEIGRHNPERVRRLFIKHQDRIFFATDFQVYSRLILGSAGDAERPSDDEAAQFFHKEWRWLETEDRDWPHMTPIQGDWNISSIGLPTEVLRKIYFDNARRLLVRSLPFTRIRAARIAEDFPIEGRDRPGTWSRATPFPLEQQTQDGKARPELSTTCRVLWSDRFLYLQYDCPFKTLTVYPTVQKEERIKNGQALWDKDVVEAFIGSDPAHPDHYTEYEWAPNGESLDLKIRRPHSDFAWSSGMESVVTVDEERKVWKCSVRIPLSALSETAPQPGTKWRMNLYRIDRAHKAFLASNPTLNGSFHTFDRFGWLEFEK
ncbi:MAG: amidohydrolase family protein [Verrucomicrobiales bacterium]|nr:amidohydrolase family protein [Verrucomicrobiales bacterium]